MGPLSFLRYRNQISSCAFLALSGLAGCSGDESDGTDRSRPFKGVAFEEADGNCGDLVRLGVAWYHDWNGSSRCTSAAQFVPLVWGSWKTLSWVATPAKIAASGAPAVLGFNEPDLAAQSNLSVDDAIALWSDLQLPGVLLGSPAVAGQNWLEQFMTRAQAQALRVDFIAIHWYGWEPGSCNSVTALEQKIQWAEQWNRPIWITEWSCRLQSEAVTRAFYTSAIAMFARHPLLERYAWFLTRSDGDFAGATLLDGDGNPTALGQAYGVAPAFHSR
jgi:hypothetical protein